MPKILHTSSNLVLTTHKKSGVRVTGDSLSGKTPGNGRYGFETQG